MATSLRLSSFAPTLLTLLAVAFAGCGGATSSTSTMTTTPTTPTITTPDNGTLSAVSDIDQITLTNAASGMLLGLSGQSQVAGTALAQETASASNTDVNWHVMPMGTAQTQYNVENLLTHQLMGIASASTAAGATALQWADNGTPDHLWQFYLLKDGNYLIQNVNSSLYLEDANSGTTSSAIIDQGARATTGSGCTCQEWALTVTTTPAYPAPRTVNGTGIYVHDPDLIVDTNGVYWLYGTHQTLAYSTDLTTFTYTTANSAMGACTATEGTAWLTVDSRCPIIGPDFPSWTGLQTPLADNNGQNTDVWAPSVLYANGTYYQYYSVPYEPSTGAEAIIGLAISATPYGPWTDQGVLVSSWTAATTAAPTNSVWNFSSASTWNAIDPAPFIDATGNWWLSFGSWQDGIHLMQLNPATGLPLAPSATYPVISYRAAGEEGSFIYPWIVNGTQYYYLFAPINVCCSATSPYRIIVGRATSPNGPYVDRGGLNLATGGGGTLLLSTHGNIVGPGGQSVFTDTVNGVATPTLVYHYYDGNNNGTPTLGINRLGFTSDGWPYVE